MTQFHPSSVGSKVSDEHHVGSQGGQIVINVLGEVLAWGGSALISPLTQLLCTPDECTQWPANYLSLL